MKLFIILYLVAINIVGIILMYSDKKKAIKNKWRTPEKAFFIVSLIGGSLGTLIGMYTFRHKTKHMYFVIGIPALLVLNIVIIVLLISNGII